MQVRWLVLTKVFAFNKIKGELNWLIDRSSKYFYNGSISAFGLKSGKISNIN